MISPYIQYEDSEPVANLETLQKKMLSGELHSDRLVVVPVPLSVPWWNNEAYTETVQDAHDTWFLAFGSISSKRKLLGREYTFRVAGPAWRVLAWSLTIYDVPRRGGHV